jgi:photosystem II stability/assembly factor-like uncharacterized protein
MKTIFNFGKAAAFLVLLFVLTASSFAQTPQYYNFQVNEGTNYFPFGVTGGKECQWLYPAGNLNTPSGVRSGMITKVYFYMGYTNGNAVLTDLLIKLGQASITDLPTGVIYTGKLDTVYFRASVTVISTIGAWMSFTLDKPYAFDSTKSLIVDVSQCGATNTSVVVCQHSYTGFKRCYINGTTACVFTYAGQDAAAANFGVDVTPVLPNGWVEQTSGTVNGLNTVSTVSDQVGWVGGNGGVVLRTTNAGTNWTNVTGTPIGTDAVYAICGIDANTCLVSTSPAATFVFKTTNGGTNWTQVFTQASPGFIDDIKMFSATNGFMYGDPVGARWTLFKTTNAGTNWDSTGLYLPQAGSEAGWNNAMCLKGTNLWFGTNNTRVYYSTNSGVNWLYGATTGTVNQYSVAFNGGGGIGFAGQTVAVKSTNGGANWAAFTVPGTGTIYGFSNILNEFWYGASTSIIYYSSDNGATFASQYSNPVTTALYQSLSFALTGNTIRGWAVTASGLISRYNETVTGITHNENEVPSSYSLSQNYPNPFNPSTKITYQLPKSENVRVTVFDLLGREVAVLVNEFKTAGTYNIEFNASQLSSGVYLYRIDAGEFKDVKKMVLVK